MRFVEFVLENKFIGIKVWMKFFICLFEINLLLVVVVVGKKREDVIIMLCFIICCSYFFFFFDKF